MYVLLLFSLVSFACGGVIIDIPTRGEDNRGGTSTATQVKKLTTTPKPTATQSRTPSPSATHQPEDTLAPTNSPLPTSSATPSPSPVPTIPTVIIAGWEGVKIETVCLAVWDHYPQSMGSFSRADEIAAAAGGLLSQLGIQSAPLGEACEADLTVMLAFQAVGTQYSDEGVIYTGAVSNGQLTISAPERERLVLPVSSIALFPIDPSSTSWQPGSPSAAPYELVWREPVLSGLAQIWGEAVLLVSLGQDEWQAEASKVLNDSEHAPIQTRQPPSSDMNGYSSQLTVEHHPNPATFILSGVSNREFTCYFQTTVKALDAGVHILSFGMDYLFNGEQAPDMTSGSGPWSADEFADWYECPGAFIPAGEDCTDGNNWLGSDKNAPFVGVWYYHGEDDQGNPVSGEAEIECVPE
jgi:hypothetical protein